MTSAPHQSQPPLKHPPAETGFFSRSVYPLSLLRRYYSRSIGTRLFVAVLGSAFVGIGGIAFLLSEVVKDQAESEIQQTLNDKVQILESTLEPSQLLAKSLRASVLTLHHRRAIFPETYRQLTLQIFQERPDSVIGLGLGQGPNGLLPQQEWFFASYHADREAGETEQRPSNAQIRFDNGAQPHHFYPTSDRYQTYFLSQKDGWSNLDQAGGDLSPPTYYSQLFNKNGRWLGTVFVEVDRAVFDQAIAGPVFYDAGYFALLTENGQILSQPSALATANPSPTYESIPGLAAIWPELSNQSGLIEGETGYWAYARIPDSQWVSLAFVPYSALFSRILWITLGGTIGIGLFLALMMALTLRSLRRHLRPVLQECNFLAATDSAMLSTEQNEIEQISTSFFYLLSQVKASEARIQQEMARTVQAEVQLKQAALIEQKHQSLQAEITQLANIIAAIDRGDLTLKAEVQSQISGLVAETLNRCIERWGQTIAMVLGAAQQNHQSAESLQAFSTSMNDTIQQQQRSLNQTRTLIQTIYTLSQTTEQQIAKTGEKNSLTQTSIHQGQQTMLLLAKGINTLQQETNQIVKRTQTLTSYVGLAAQFAKDQKRMAAMTRVLAVNASMLANRASAQQDPEQLAVITREFETIAGQVNQLALQTNQSLVSLQQRTDQIQTVVSGLNHDVQEISQHVGSFSSGVNQSRQVFDLLKAISDQVAGMEQNIIQSSQSIVMTSQTALQSLQDISTLSIETLSQTPIAQAEQMEQWAIALLKQAEFFQLRPEQHLLAERSLFLTAASTDTYHANGSGAIGASSAQFAVPSETNH